MTKDIEKAARAHAELGLSTSTLKGAQRNNKIREIMFDFEKGAESRQPEIDQLKSALKEATEWISVEERLPNELIDVIIEDGSGNFERGRYFLEAWWRSDGFVSEGSSSSYAKYDPDDWMPIRWRPISVLAAAELLKEE